MFGINIQNLVSKKTTLLENKDVFMKKTMTLFVILISLHNWNFADGGSSFKIPELKDKRSWKLSSIVKDKDLVTNEYMLEEEEIENWSELFTITAIFDNYSPFEFYEDLIASYQASCEPEGFQYKTLKKDDNSITYEFFCDASKFCSSEKCEPLVYSDEKEVGKIIKAENGNLIYIRYTTRKIDDIENLPIYINFLENIENYNVPLQKEIL